MIGRRAVTGGIVSTGIAALIWRAAPSRADATGASSAIAKTSAGSIEGLAQDGVFAFLGVPKHACRQLSSGRWTSILGNREDMEHALNDLTGGQLLRVSGKHGDEGQHGQPLISNLHSIPFVIHSSNHCSAIV